MTINLKDVICNLIKYFKLKKLFYMWQRDDKKNEDKRSRTCTIKVGHVL